jgi:hypothetical protein
MLALSQDQVKSSRYTCQEIEGDVKVYWKGLMKKVNDKEMLTLTVSGSDDQTKQTPIAIDAFFKFLDALQINGQKVTGDVCSMNCTGKRKGKDGGKGEVVGVKFAEVWMNAVTVSQNVSDNFYSDCLKLVENFPEDLSSVTTTALLGMAVKFNTALAGIVSRGKTLPDGEEKKALLQLYLDVQTFKNLIETEKKGRVGIVEDSSNLPF